ncbi:MAG: hypothetical protein IPJ61_17525 [Tessaracoccus sp.]|uniref:hypothetical protein n=1 Tax=Tessaracoccus sp. TaxID=1971211 RepID=UPI001EC89785|nr:hypothetical protein [Tessaracoccus sp.]MBK7822807.1 hypothetical protein [Tessaracoccus sp.]
MWPGFWLRPLTRPGGSPGNGAEIDLVETWTMSWPPPKMSATIHPNYDADPRPPHAGANLNYSVLPNSDPAALHIYTCIKTPGRIEFLCDGIRIYAWDSDVPVWNGALRHGPPPAWYNDAYEAAGTTWYPRFTLQIGMGTGGNNAEPDADWTYSEIVIPWTRIYKRSID